MYDLIFVFAYYSGLLLLLLFDHGYSIFNYSPSVHSMHVCLRIVFIG